MAKQEFEDLSENNIFRDNADEEVKELMAKFNVSEEDINVAINIIGNDREKLKKYLENNGNSRLYNIW